MSVKIEMDRRIYSDSSEFGHDYILLVKEKDIDSATPHWSCLGISWQSSLWSTIGKRAGLYETNALITEVPPNIICPSTPVYQNPQVL